MKDTGKQIEDWLDRIATLNDERAFRSLFNLFYPELIRFALFYVNVRESAEEIVQDVFLKIWQIRANLLAIKAFRAYLFTATRNQCLNYLQKTGRPFVVGLNYVSEDDLVSTTENPQQELERMDMQQQIDTAINTLPPQCRLIFQLVKEQGLSYKEVATLLTISPRTVEAQIAIALRKLAAILHTLSEL
ncbi:MAG: RNA polymerase sigma-70 factor [Bacteroidetes bacterium]|nr:RNA polymerase sigma-70 factor [Fibrella sp.]